MNIEDSEALEEVLDTLYERISVHRRAIGFVADHVTDDQAMANLMIQVNSMTTTQNIIASLLGRKSEEDSGHF
jgi:hypothetical protein